MNPANLGGAPYFVPPEPSRWPSLTLAAVVHLGLLAFLWIGVHWHNTAPVAVEAEVWDMRTQRAAPPPLPTPKPLEPVPTPVPPTPRVVQPPVEPAPTPKAPDINLERAKVKAEKQKQAEEQKRELLEKKAADKRLAKEKNEQKAQELADQQLKELSDKKKLVADKLAKAKKEADEKKVLDKARETEMRRITGATGTSGEAPKSTAPRLDTGYVASLTAKIKSNIIYTGSRDLAGDPRAIYRIDQSPSGDILRVKQIKSSGVPEYDRAVEQAITASAPLPKKRDGTVEHSIEPEFKLKD